MRRHRFTPLMITSWIAYDAASCVLYAVPGVPDWLRLIGAAIGVGQIIWFASVYVRPEPKDVPPPNSRAFKLDT